MSASAITPAQSELISSLSQDDIPIKLRCAICSRLAVNAFRLPCCDQSICEACQSTLPSTCPVCEHSPVASEDCKPHKSLRTTIRVFLRTEEKKREALRLKEAKDTPPATPVEPEAVQAVAPTPLSPKLAPTATVDAPVAEVKSEPSPAADVADPVPANPEELAQLQEVQQDIPQPSIEEIAPGQEPTLDADVNITEVDGTEGGEGQKDAKAKASDQPEGASQTAFGTGFGFDTSATGGFPGGFGGDMSQMQMMMAMQNGMAPNAFANFPMMGMPGMNMDPLMMQNMFMNGGFGAGMGVNSMNGLSMGLGMGGFEGGVGGGFNNGWNGQQSWNVAPDNFNNPNAAGMGSGEYGANNSGYASQATGYNQGNYGRGNQYNDYQNTNFGYRGRGRGRGRGGYGYGSHESSQQYPQQFGTGHQANGPISETGSIPTGPKVESTPASNVDEFGREIRQTSEAKDTPTESEIPKDETTPAQITTANGDEALANTGRPSAEVEAVSADSSAPKPIQTLDDIEAPYNAGNYNAYNNQYQGRGGYYNGPGSMNPPVKPVDVPINAPTGPKAMREGLPNTSIAHLRARGFVTASPSPMVNGSTSVAPEPSEKDQKEKDRSRSPCRERSRSRSRDRRRSRSPERHRSHRHRHRSTSLSEDEKETERRRQRRKERHRRRTEEGERDDTGSGDKTVDEGKGDADQDRSRSASPSASKRSSHRSRKDKDKYRERERDSDREHRSSHKHRSSHRSHRDDRSRSRDRDRDRERDREHRHRRSRRESEAPEETPEKVESSIPPTPTEPEHPSRKPSLISNGSNGIEIKGAGIRRKNTLEEIIIPTGPRAARDRQQEKLSATSRHREDEHRSSRHRDSDKDKERERTKEKERLKPTSTTTPTGKNPHEEEREARNRERLLKEAQRMAGLSGLAAGTRKRSRDDGEDARRSKKKGRRGEESDEARVARLEAERESARW